MEEGGAYYYRLWYDQDTARFETLPTECCYGNQSQSEDCHSCKRAAKKEKVIKKDTDVCVKVKLLCLNLRRRRHNLRVWPLMRVV